MKPLRLRSITLAGFFFPVLLLHAATLEQHVDLSFAGHFVFRCVKFPDETPANTPDNCTLPAPSSLSASALSATTATLVWSGVTNAYAYHVRVYALPEGNLVSDFLDFDLNATLSGLSSGVAYRCYVSAVCTDTPGNEVENSIVIDIILNNSSPGNKASGAFESPEENPQVVMLGNPFSDLLRFGVETGAPLPYRLQLISADGRLILEKNGVVLPGETLSVAAPELAPGLYFVRMETAGRVQVFRMIRE